MKALCRLDASRLEVDDEDWNKYDALDDLKLELLLYHGNKDVGDQVKKAASLCLLDAVLSNDMKKAASLLQAGAV